MSPQIKLTYFDAPARAELARLAFAAGAVAFEDERIGFGDLPALKPSLPLGQLPVLAVDGQIYPQSMAIARYAGRLSGVYPSDALEALKVDMVLDSISEIFFTLGDIKFRTPDEAAKTEKIAALKTGQAPSVFGFIESTIQGKFLLGAALSLADLFVFDLINNSLLPMIPDFSFAAFPKIAATFQNVKDEPAVAAYLGKQQQ